MKENLIKHKSFNYALEIIALYKNLQEEKEYVISQQILCNAYRNSSLIPHSGFLIHFIC